MIRNAKIIGTRVNSDSYHGQQVERGSRDFVMSSSSLRAFGHCPERWRHGYSAPGSEAKEWGSLIDTRLLTPEQFASRYAVEPKEYQSSAMKCPNCESISDSKSCKKCKTERVEMAVTKPWNGNSTVCAKWVEDQNGKQIVTERQVFECDAAIKRLRMDPIISSFIDDCEKQVHISAEWHDEKTSIIIPIQCLLDLVPPLDSVFPSVAGDLKSTRSGAIQPWGRFCYQMGYHIQGAFGLDLLNAAEGFRRDTGRQNFVFVLVENFAPWQPAKRMLDENFLDLGRMEYDRLLHNYAACLAADKWPGYDDHPESVQGWTVLRPESWMAERVLGSKPFDFSDEPPDEVASNPQNDAEAMGVMP